jgi:hypothetical protein
VAVFRGMGESASSQSLTICQKSGNGSCDVVLNARVRR